MSMYSDDDQGTQAAHMANERQSDRHETIDIEDVEDYRDVWGFIRSVAHGWPEQSAPDYVQEIYIAALKQVAKHMLEVHAMDEQTERRRRGE